MKEERLVSNMNKCGNREGWLDSLRAFAVLLVVVGHIAELWDDDFMRYLNRGLYLFHMPLFFVMSGITFEMFTIKSQIDLRKIWVKRVGNLLIPAFFFVLVQFLFDSKRDIFTVYSGVWFLVFLALVLSVEIIILMFERNKGKKSGGGYFMY